MRAGKNAEDIRSITIRTHEACLRIIDKKGPLANPADRDHCVQYMVAIPLLFGRLTAADYEDWIATDPRIDAAARAHGVRGRAGLYARLSRSGEALDCQLAALELNDGTVLEETVEYPIGHRRRREEGLPLLVEKFKTNLRRRFTDARQRAILEASLDRDTA
jgi:2-methylcitrate dehydratase